MNNLTNYLLAVARPLPVIGLFFLLKCATSGCSLGNRLHTCRPDAHTDTAVPAAGNHFAVSIHLPDWMTMTHPL